MTGVGTRETKASLTLLVVAVMGAALLYCLRSGEPVYQGKPLRSWLEQFGTNHWSAGHRDFDRDSEAALQYFGTNAAPIYLRLLTSKESPFKAALLRHVPKSWLALFHFPSHDEYVQQVDQRKSLGAFGFVALGMKAKPFVPSLMVLNRDQDQRTRYLALFALRCLGPEASEALPEMIECLHDPDMTIRSEAAMGIGEIHIEPEKSVHILMDFLDKYRTDRMQWFPRDDAIRSLAKFGAQARPAVPILIGLLNDREKGIREAATNALREIDADAAAQAGVK